MSAGVAPPQAAPGNSAASAEAEPPAGWEALRRDPQFQFEPLPPTPNEVPQEPGMFESFLVDLFEFLAEFLSPVGKFIAGAWPVLQWVLLAGLVVIAGLVIIRLIGPLPTRDRSRGAKARRAAGDPEWAPTTEQSQALLEDADALAAKGRYDEATRLLLQRSIAQIAAARPALVEPSSTAREIAALPVFSEVARSTFTAISEAVERSLFALRSLDRTDWDRARAAYAAFAMEQIGDHPGETSSDIHSGTALRTSFT